MIYLRPKKPTSPEAKASALLTLPEGSRWVETLSKLTLVTLLITGKQYYFRTELVIQLYILIPCDKQFACTSFNVRTPSSQSFDYKIFSLSHILRLRKSCVSLCCFHTRIYFYICNKIESLSPTSIEFYYYTSTYVPMSSVRCLLKNRT